MYFNLNSQILYIWKTVENKFFMTVKLECRIVINKNYTIKENYIILF